MSQQFKKGGEAWFWGQCSLEPAWGIVRYTWRGKVYVGHTAHNIIAVLEPEEVFTNREACIDAEVAKEVKRHEDAMKRLEALRG